MITTGFYLTSTWETGIYSENCYGDTAVHRPVSILQSILQYPKPQNSFPSLELGLIKTKKEHSVSVVVFLMVGGGGAKIQRATSAAAPDVSASVVSSLSASTAEKVASNPARHVDTIRYIVTKKTMRENNKQSTALLSVSTTCCLPEPEATATATARTVPCY